jgi:hypothetical protein
MAILQITMNDLAMVMHYSIRQMDMPMHPEGGENLLSKRGSQTVTPSPCNYDSLYIIGDVLFGFVGDSAQVINCGDLRKYM